MMFGIMGVGWLEVINPKALLALLAAVLGYVWMIRRGKGTITAGKMACFFSGILLLYVSVAGPLGVLSHQLFSAHMLSMAIAYFAAPPLILLGLTEEMARPFFQWKFVRKSMAVFLHPIVSLFLFNTLFSLYHIPVIHDAAHQNPALLSGVFLVLLFSAFVMWMQVVPPLPEYHRLNDLPKIGYIFANGVLITPACAVIIFAGEPLYDTFHMLHHIGHMAAGGHGSHSSMLSLLSLLTPLGDQQLGGIVMKLSQEVIYGSILAYLFVQWFRKEKGTIDPLPEGFGDDKPQGTEGEKMRADWTGTGRVQTGES